MYSVKVISDFFWWTFRVWFSEIRSSTEKEPKNQGWRWYQRKIISQNCFLDINVLRSETIWCLENIKVSSLCCLIPSRTFFRERYPQMKLFRFCFCLWKLQLCFLHINNKNLCYEKWNLLTWKQNLLFVPSISIIVTKDEVLSRRSQEILRKSQLFFTDIDSCCKCVINNFFLVNMSRASCHHSKIFFANAWNISKPVGCLRLIISVLIVLNRNFSKNWLEIVLGIASSTMTLNMCCWNLNNILTRSFDFLSKKNILLLVEVHV